MVEMIAGSRLLICNDYERGLIEQATGLDEKALLARTGALLTTQGETGSELRTPDELLNIPAVGARQVVDPTGAGDAYRAGLMAGMADGRPLPEAARMGAVCASFAIEKMGTQEHGFDGEAFSRRWRDNFDSDTP
jgi:adenosine kinase